MERATFIEEHLGDRVTWDVQVKRVNWRKDSPSYFISAIPVEEGKEPPGDYLNWVNATFDSDDFREAVTAGNNMKITGRLNAASNENGAILRSSNTHSKSDAQLAARGRPRASSNFSSWTSSSLMRASWKRPCNRSCSNWAWTSSGTGGVLSR